MSYAVHILNIPKNFDGPTQLMGNYLLHNYTVLLVFKLKTIYDKTATQNKKGTLNMDQ